MNKVLQQPALDGDCNDSDGNQSRYYGGYPDTLPPPPDLITGGHHPTHLSAVEVDTVPVLRPAESQTVNLCVVRTDLHYLVSPSRFP